MADAPALSIVLVGRDGYRTIRPILACLARQTIADRIEVVAVLPQAEEPGLPDEITGAFGTFKPVVVGPISNRGVAAAEGVGHVRAPVVAFSENHCFPEPDWAERLLPHYDDPTVAGAAPVVSNGNPETGLSWACYATGYANFVADELGDVDQMPNHNTTYRTSELTRRSNRLTELLRHEGKLQADIRAEGGRFVMDPKARTRHLNEATWYLSVGLNYINGCYYGASQVQVYSWPQRIARAIAFPLAAIPIFRGNLRRLAAVEGRSHMDVEGYLGLGVMSLAHAFGEAVAYLGYKPTDFRFLEEEVYMVTERLGRRQLTDPEIAGFVQMMKETSR